MKKTVQELEHAFSKTEKLKLKYLLVKKTF